MATTTRTSKTYTISLPPDLAAKADGLAKLESRTMSELFREAFRVYYARHIDQVFAETAAYAATRNPMGYTEEDVPRLIKEVRAQAAAEEAARQAAKAS
ncbi:MAG: ribbon-helix-helix domain-containing protein [Acidobacteriaceae bacterium]|jgi:CopG family transcriptional regulator/antitoxin EndoAI